ncbi:MAG: hypothetical protein H6619_04755, partial [Deltaproteobacteria bacterium]|nr:hypothetical protein [Deltaproteobacteria bacterium]
MYGFFDFVFTLGAQAGTCEGCAGSALHPIAAALGTLGYYAQAGWLEQILYFGFGNWAILAYVLAGVGLLISVAMGQPPKMYLWFVIGPPLFYWLVENRTPSTGVEWRVGKQHRDMSEVWKLSEVGLYNTPYIIRHGFEVYSDAPPDGSDSSGPDGEFSDCYDYACVSDFFAWFDQLISDTVHELIGIIGLNIVKERVAPDDETNISSGGDLEADFDSQFQDITSQYRWQFFASIADARLSNTDFRQLFSTFMANECGDALLNSIDKRIFSAMKNKQPDDNDLFEYVIKMNSSGKLKLWENLRNAGAVPMPRSLEKILDAHASDAESFAVQSNIKAIVDATNKKNKITCRTLMQVIIHGFRWEAANISYQLINSGPSGVDPTQFVAHMVYGWAVKEYEVDLGFQGDQLTNEQILKFLESYILVHLFKNELRIAPQNPAEKPVLASERMVQSTEDFQAVNGQKSKFGELHVWSRMVPYFQGQLLYFLALAYPFACMLIVVPGMHTMFFQWMQFWIWVKLWDLGFALAMMIERTIWAMTVNKFANQEANNTL